ncbi:MAG: cytochrome c3 family protein [Anaerolineales bacterium]|jgi:predicted CXXCH cytochrome family protein
MKRILVGLVFAIPLAVFSFGFSQTPAMAQEGGPNIGPEDCQTCHSDTEHAWEEGSHGNATVDPIFVAAWQQYEESPECLACHTTGFDTETGEYESEGIGCVECHSPINPNHPLEPMSANRSAELCGDCHTTTFFEWSVSSHGANDMDCVVCHDPHATDLKEYNASTLCATCHQTTASNYTHTAHNEVGLSCADCHLSPPSEELDGHAGAPDHSFDVKLETCNACHAEEMHEPIQTGSETTGAEAEEPVDAMASSDTVVVTAEPSQVSPLGFATLSGLIGMAAGMILAPWLEKLYRRINEDE